MREVKIKLKSKDDDSQQHCWQQPEADTDPSVPTGGRPYAAWCLPAGEHRSHKKEGHAATCCRSGGGEPCKRYNMGKKTVTTSHLLDGSTHSLPRSSKYTETVSRREAAAAGGQGGVSPDCSQVSSWVGKMVWS